MNEAAEGLAAHESATQAAGHRRWVRLCHWIGVLVFFTLGITGVFILAVHPRLYWGEVGNDLTPALLEIPISANHRPDGFEHTVSFTDVSDTAISANRTYPIFNQNGWARSLHFLSAWIFVFVGIVYLLAGIASGHIRRNLLPTARDLAPRTIWQDLKNHAALRFGSTGGGPPYGALQRCAYISVALVALPLMVITGLAMSPAVTAAYPFLLDVFGGYQSARTVHFFCFAALLLFLIVHVAMVVLTGLRRQLRAMILGS